MKKLLKKKWAQSLVLKKRQLLISEIRSYVHKDLRMSFWAIITIFVYLVLFTGFIILLTLLLIQGEALVGYYKVISLIALFLAIMTLVGDQWGNSILSDFTNAIRFLPLAIWLFKVCELLEESRIDSFSDRHNLRLAENKLTEMFKKRKSINVRETKELITSWNIINF